MKKVAFICVHNSCRSQIAEALGKHLASDVFESYSAGTETKPQINQDAVRLMKRLYGIDMEQTQYSKLISEIPDPDIAISMGCNVSCPFIGREFDDNWGLEDPTGKPDEEFIKVMKEIETKIMQLKVNLCSESDSKVEKAAAYFENGFNCSQAVFTTFATDYGISEELALKVATQFGGGARKGEMCGAVAGALMVLGLVEGHCHTDAPEEKAHAYKRAEEFMDSFIEKNGTVVCRELLGYDITKQEDKVKINELGLFKTICPKMIKCATEIVEQMLKDTSKG